MSITLKNTISPPLNSTVQTRESVSQENTSKAIENIIQREIVEKKLSTNAILTRKEARSYQQILGPESNLYHEIAMKVVCHENGIVQLSNGIKIDTTPPKNRLLGGTKTRDMLVKIEKDCANVNSRLKSIQSVFEEKCSSLSETTSQEDFLRLLNTFTNESKELKGDFEKISDFHIFVIRSLEEKLEKNQRLLEKIQKEDEALKCRISKLNKEIEISQERLEKIGDLKSSEDLLNFLQMRAMEKHTIFNPVLADGYRKLERDKNEINHLQGEFKNYQYEVKKAEKTKSLIEEKLTIYPKFIKQLDKSSCSLQNTKTSLDDFVIKLHKFRGLVENVERGNPKQRTAKIILEFLEDMPEMSSLLGIVVPFNVTSSSDFDRIALERVRINQETKELESKRQLEDKYNAVSIQCNLPLQKGPDGSGSLGSSCQGDVVNGKLVLDAAIDYAKFKGISGGIAVSIKIDDFAKRNGRVTDINFNYAEKIVGDTCTVFLGITRGECIVLAMGVFEIVSQDQMNAQIKSLKKSYKNISEQLCLVSSGEAFTQCRVNRYEAGWLAGSESRGVSITWGGTSHTSIDKIDKSSCIIF